ncbi:hypothetical protein [Microcoleus sp. bin38.metabat.b11b12b14.051]|uniref:hypothetical protein n=1 Tax=Microcoleus sp. bin38.metabat.b11b12b14.051 TaxID=2742709 RepID=UPI0025D3B4AA|nr:hypothetical protein [Microcoleus sp. bin38.metabat.b11b12b14.051]
MRDSRQSEICSSSNPRYVRLAERAFHERKIVRCDRQLLRLLLRFVRAIALYQNFQIFSEITV